MGHIAANKDELLKRVNASLDKFKPLNGHWNRISIAPKDCMLLLPLAEPSMA
jgi:hypothetical protein